MMHHGQAPCSNIYCILLPCCTLIALDKAVFGTDLRVAGEDVSLDQRAQNHIHSFHVHHA